MPENDTSAPLIHIMASGNDVRFGSDMTENLPPERHPAVRANDGAAL
jgi:hypothetical protein